MIDWLNSNQGFVMCLLTLIYVLATVVIVIMNKLSINEMQKNRLEDSRPYIMINLVKDPRDRCFYVRIKNYGKTGAVLSSITISPDLNFVKDSGEKIVLDGCMFPPNHMIQLIVLEEWEKTSENDYNVEITYDSLESNPRHFTEKYKLVVQYAHLQGYTDTQKSGKSDVENAIINISNSLDSIRNKM